MDGISSFHPEDHLGSLYPLRIVLTDVISMVMVCNKLEGFFFRFQASYSCHGIVLFGVYVPNYRMLRPFRTSNIVITGMMVFLFCLFLFMN